MSETSEQGTALAIIPASQISTIVGADKNDILGRLRAELSDYIPDATTEEGRAEIGSKAKKVGVAKQDFVRLADGLKADAQKVIKGVNAEVKVIETNMDAMRDSILAPRVAYQERWRQRVEAHEAALKAVSDLFATLALDASSADIMDRLRLLRPSADREWEEFEQRATEAFKTTMAALKGALHEAQQREAAEEEQRRLAAEAAEQERQRLAMERAEREAKIASEAAEAARLAAEAEATRKAAEAAAEAERARIAAEAETSRRLRETEERAAAAAAQITRERQAEETRASAAFAAERQRARDIEIAADRERLAAQAREEAQKVRAEAAERAAEAARIQSEKDAVAAVERERQRVAAEQEHLRLEQESREADKAHRASINRDAMADMVTAGLSDKYARSAITAVAKGSVRHVSIRY